MISGAFTLVGTLGIMIYTNIWLTLITVAFLPVFAFGGSALMKRSRKYYIGQQAALGAVNGYIEENVAGQKVVKVFCHEDTCIEEFGKLNDDLRGKQQKARSGSRSGNPAKRAAENAGITAQAAEAPTGSGFGLGAGAPKPSEAELAEIQKLFGKG